MSCQSFQGLRKSFFATSLLMIFLLSPKSFATQCLDFFPDPVASFASNGSVSFAANSKLIGSDTVLDIGILTDLSAASCDSAACTTSGSNTASLNFPAFQTTTSSTDVTVALNGSQTMNQVDLDQVSIQANGRITVQGQDGQVRIARLTLADNAQIVLTSGVYFIDELSMSTSARINVTTGNRAIIYVNSASLGSTVQINASGSADQLVISASGNVSMGSGATASAYLYALGEVNLGQNTQFYGAINAQSVQLAQNATVTYQVAQIEQANFNAACGLNALLPNPIVHYSMDMCLSPQRNKGIKDEIGSNDADALNGVSVDFDGKYCQGAYFDGDKTAIDIQDAGWFDLQQGSLSLWVNAEDLSFSNAPSAGRQGIVSKDAVNGEIDDRLSLLLEPSGQLLLNLRGENNTWFTTSPVITEGAWHHVTLTWGPSGVYLYTDGALRGSDTSNTSAKLQPNGLDMALGASSRQFNLSANIERSSQLRDFFKGSLDELKVFDVQLNAAQVSRLYTLAAQSCDSCSNSPVLLSHFSSDICSIEANEIVDVVSGYNGTSYNGVSTEVASRFCQGLKLDGDTSFVHVPNQSDYQNSGGAIALWFKIDDLSHTSNPLVFSSGSQQLGNTLFSKGVPDDSSEGYTLVRVTEGGRLAGRIQTDSARVRFTGSGLVSENTWHHMVLSFGAQGLQIYLDGTEVFADPFLTTAWDQNSADLVLGALGTISAGNSPSTSSLNNFLKGELDDVKIYRNQPSAADVNAWYNDSDYVCSSCSFLVAQYTFDDADISGDFVNDVSGNGNTGQFQRNLSTVLPSDNIACRALEVPDSRSRSNFENFDTGIDLNDIGNQGGVSFWYRSTSDWGGDGPKQLLDATRGNKFFYLSIRDNGSLSFGAEDENDRDVWARTAIPGIKANEWVHIALSWNYDARFMTILLNGREYHRQSWGSWYNNIAPYGTLTFGDNKSTYIVLDMTGNSADGYFDDIRVYRQMVTEAQAQLDMANVQACESTVRYLIEHPESASACASPSVTLKACANDDCSELSADPATLRLTPADAWAQSLVTFTGQTQVQLSYDETGTLTIGSDGQTPLAPVSCEPDCTIEYEEFGLEFFNPLTGQTEFSSTPLTAESSFSSLGLRATQKSGASCDALVSNSQTINIQYQCITSESTPYLTGGCQVPFAGIPLSTSGPHSGSIDLDFDANGLADFAGLSFADVGVLSLTASMDIGTGESVSASTLVSVAPDSLLLDNTAPTKPTAGLAFETTIQAKGALGGTLVSYQANELEVSAQRVTPSSSSGNDAEINFNSNNAITTSTSIRYAPLNSLSFASGNAAISNTVVEEVGTYIIRVRDDDYLGKQVSSNEMALGPVIPAYFSVRQVNSAVLQPSAITFTYVGQAFGFLELSEPELEITAYNAQGQVTRNYADSLWRLPADLSRVDSFVNYTDTSVYSGDILSVSKADSVMLSNQNIYDGKATVRLSEPLLKYNKIASPAGADASPFDAALSIDFAPSFFTDLDNVCFKNNASESTCRSFSIDSVGGTQMRYGRLALENTFGPEDRALRVPAVAQYLLNGRWQTNLQDNATVIQFTQANGDIDIIHDPQSSNNLASEISGLLANSTLMGGYSSGNDLVISPVIVSGSAQSGSFFISLDGDSTGLAWSEYLNIDWDGDGDIDSDDQPSAAVSFGLYRGDDKTIHWRESF
ncbi:DUF6701 domain-containing protein [Ningiella sp. W23]|uniref:DUF6701 domain-containing protein n=1 Tax=Ningiella sp. W23 TaxID=3023715 RepID=UPI003756AF61